MQQPRSSKPKIARGAKRNARFDGSRLRKAREASGLTQEEVAELADVSTVSVQRAESGTTIAYETAVAICVALKLDTSDYLLPDDETVTLIPIPSDSRIITGDMIVRGGNYINGTPFAFEAALTLRAASDGDLVNFECALYRERNVTKYPLGKSMDDYTPEAWAALPTEEVRDYAWNKTPARLSGAYGIYGGGNNVSPLGVSEPMMVIDGQDVPLRSDLVTLTKPYRLTAGQAVMVRYGRVCSPASPDEAPADYIYRATIECRLGFLSPTAPTVKQIKWVLDYSQGGELSLRR